MVIRRLASAIREQNWFTVALEILIVIVGIFLGLQVDDWNQRRLDRADERASLVGLHKELLDAISVRDFIRKRRFENWQYMRGALDILFHDSDRAELTGLECRAVYNSFIRTANIAELPSFNALLASGRLYIIGDDELRSALVQFGQRREALFRFAAPGGTTQLGPAHPELFSINPVFEKANDNLDLEVTCDLEAMRRNPTFLLEFYANADRYDSYIKSGLLPVTKSIERLHTLLDQNLGLVHNGGETK